MKINRKEHPFISKQEFSEFVEELTELELKSLIEVLEDETFALEQYEEQAVDKINELKTRISVLCSEIAEDLESIVNPSKSEQSKKTPSKK